MPYSKQKIIRFKNIKLMIAKAYKNRIHFEMKWTKKNVLSKLVDINFQCITMNCNDTAGPNFQCTSMFHRSIQNLACMFLPHSCKIYLQYLAGKFHHNHWKNNFHCSTGCCRCKIVRQIGKIEIPNLYEI